MLVSCDDMFVFEIQCFTCFPLYSSALVSVNKLQENVSRMFLKNELVTQVPALITLITFRMSTPKPLSLSGRY